MGFKSYSRKIYYVQKFSEIKLTETKRQVIKV
jgi:hypothetical protein